MDGAERILTIVSYLAALAVIVAAGLTTGFSGLEPTTLQVVVLVVLAVPAVFLLTFSLLGLISYFVFIPSIAEDGHLFSRVHATNLLHPLTTSLVLGLAALCVLTGSVAALVVWAILLVIYVLQTALIVRRTLQEHLVNEGEGKPSMLFLLLDLIVGGEVVTIAGGARPLPPWRLHSLPDDTWIVDVRTKPEFHWNRLQGAEHYPWGAGLIEAAKDKPKDRPVLVVCFSGHRSPAVAVMMRRMGFKTVYNLNWGILYLVILERGRSMEGPFGLTRPRRDPQRRGEDLRGITRGYVAMQGVMLVGAPLEHALLGRHVPQVQTILGLILALGGLGLGILSFRALGRNFRVYMAPRRSGTLVTTGIYRLVRHPMYTGVIIGFLGYIILFGSLFLIPAWFVMALLYIIKTAREERALAEKYPDYEAYHQRTWKFIPYVY